MGSRAARQGGAAWTTVRAVTPGPGRGSPAWPTARRGRPPPGALPHVEGAVEVAGGLGGRPVWPARSKGPPGRGHARPGDRRRGAGGRGNGGGGEGDAVGDPRHHISTGAASSGFTGARASRTSLISFCHARRTTTRTDCGGARASGVPRTAAGVPPPGPARRRWRGVQQQAWPHAQQAWQHETRPMRGRACGGEHNASCVAWGAPHGRVGGRMRAGNPRHPPQSSTPTSTTIMGLACALTPRTNA